ncbi:MAG: hypothetical protein DRP09_18555, partial [Candidatus Thorarchaeota archaeon]
MREDHKVKILIDAENRASKHFEILGKQLERLAQSVDRISAGVEKQFGVLSSRIDRVSQSLSQLNERIKRTGFNWRGLVWTIVRAEIVFRAIMRIIHAVGDTFAYMRDTLDEYQISLLQLTAVHTTMLSGVIRSQEELQRTFDRFYEINKNIYKELELLSVRTPLTADQLMRL